MNRKWDGSLTEEEMKEAERIKELMKIVIQIKNMDDEEKEDYDLAEDIAFPCIWKCIRNRKSETFEYREVLEEIMDSETERILSLVCESNRRKGLCRCPYHKESKAAGKRDEDRKREEECGQDDLIDEELPF